MKSLLERFGITTCSDVKVPMTCGTHISPSLENPTSDLKTYRSMIGSLLYLYSSRPNILFSVCNCARYQANLREPNIIVAKYVFQYLHCTPTLGLWYL